MRAEILPVAGTRGRIRLRFTGDGRESQWLARARAFLGRRPDGDYLEFDPPADFLGIEVKRRPYQETDLVQLGAGSSVETDEVDLSDLYELPGDVGIRVRYVGYHPLAGPTVGGGPFEPVVSEWVTLADIGAPSAR
jgi:hypothetical protein